MRKAADIDRIRRMVLWGRLDVARFGELLLPRIRETELQPRIPGLRHLSYVPLGLDYPEVLDAGLPSLERSVFSDSSVARLAEGVNDCVMAGSDILTGDDLSIGAKYGLFAE